MRIKVQDLTELQLDWAAAKANDTMVRIGSSGTVYAFKSGNPVMWNPSDSWAQGGPIIEREDIHWGFGTKDGKKVVVASKYGHHLKPLLGPTPLIAAMRCFVASKLGDEVEIPEELCK
jgi:hypothetical protein